MTVDIIGAGIGGLTTAIALEQKGIKTRIFEQAEQIKPVGAGITLASNAMQVYEKLGLRNAIEEKGNRISSLNITKKNLTPLTRVDLSSFEKKHKVRNIAIHRGALQQILVNKLASSELRLNHHLDTIEKNEEGYLLTFTNGEQAQSSMVIAADGINSIVRQQLFPNNEIRNAKQTCWRGVTTFSLPEKYRNELNEAWNKTDRFGFVQIAENQVYWYALKSFIKDKNEFDGNDITAYYQTYNPIVNEIIASTSTDQINTAEMLDLKPTDTWFTENLCLIGDAAHATTPNMGQGACQAIEDAYVLAECLNKYDRSSALEAFQKIRLPKAHQVVKASWMIGKIAHVSNPILIVLRNLFMRLTASLGKKQTEKIFQIPNV